MSEPCILVVGNLEDGFRFIGPFPDFDEASGYSSRVGVEGCEWVATLEAPEVAKKGQSNE